MYKIDGSELYEYQKQLLQPPEDIPIWEKKCLTVEEAAAYSGIGERKLKALLMDKDCSFRIARSDRLLIIREKLEEFIHSSTELQEVTQWQIQKEKINQERFSAKGNRNARTVLINSDGQMKTVKDIVFIRNCNDKQFLENDNPEVLLPHFSCHSLRHTFTTRMCEAGVNVKVIQDALGHKDVSTTLNIYTDVTKELRKSEFEGLELQFNQ